MPEPVLFDIEENIAIIALNRPEKRNALNQALLAALYNAVEKVARETDLRAAVITGCGPAFCAGLDLKAVTRENLLDPRGDGRDLPDVFGECAKPIIAAVNGHAITGGFELALNCDFIIASENAYFTDTHVRVGIHPGWGMTQHLQQAIGRRRAKQMSLTAQPISAPDALAWGLVNEVMPAARLIDRAREIAKEIAGSDGHMVRTVNRLIDYRNAAS
ncbi:MAG: enoyl-CoA hydratase, partial [Desulfobacterales bacterium]|nr:enoyl-CoA hydratase [Desulfobacterales bacterium]